MAKTKAKPAPVAQTPEHFDEHTPPPRQRPQGEPLPRCFRLTDGDGIASAFPLWDANGRIPARSVLCEFVGTGGDLGHSGYVVTALAQGPRGLHTELGTVGEMVPSEPLKWYRITHEIRLGRFVYVIFSPLGERR